MTYPVVNRAPKTSLQNLSAPLRGCTYNPYPAFTVGWMHNRQYLFTSCTAESKAFKLSFLSWGGI